MRLHLFPRLVLARMEARWWMNKALLAEAQHVLVVDALAQQRERNKVLAADNLRLRDHPALQTEAVATTLRATVVPGAGVRLSKVTPADEITTDVPRQSPGVTPASPMTVPNYSSCCDVCGEPMVFGVLGSHCWVCKRSRAEIQAAQSTQQPEVAT